jgi:hypothetical protein
MRNLTFVANFYIIGAREFVNSYYLRAPEKSLELSDYSDFDLIAEISGLF